MAIASSEFDVVVVGCGGIGSAILAHAASRSPHTASRSHRVLGLDAHRPPHSLGSSHGQSRIIRQAYFEHPDYVPLLLEAYTLWHHLEQQLGRALLQPLGLLQIGAADGVVVPGVMRSAREHHLPVEHLDARQTRQRFPFFHIEDREEAVYEPQAGVLWVEKCVQAHLDLATTHGALNWFDCPLLGWRPLEHGIELTTSRGTILARQVVMACGAWTPAWLNMVPMTVLRKQLHWFHSRDRQRTPDTHFPMFLVEEEQGCFYGFPDLQDRGMKVGEHSGGQIVNNPDRLDRSLCDADLERVQQFMSRRIEGTFEHREHSVCMYTMTEDQHFVIDRDPQEPRMLWACGFSGHGFKFAPVLGKLIADWLFDGHRDPRLDFLACRRKT